MRPVPRAAVFAIISDNPRHPTFRVMTNAMTPMATWDEVEGEYKHFAGRGDPALNIFRYVVEQHIRTIENLRDMI